MKRTIVAGSLATAALGVTLMASPASAAVSSIAISPTSQTVTTGSTAIWGWSWAGSGTYSTTFAYGDGGTRTYSAATNGANGSASHAFGPCATTTYTQRVTAGGATATGSTRVTFSGAC